MPPGKKEKGVAECVTVGFDSGALFLARKGEGEKKESGEKKGEENERAHSFAILENDQKKVSSVTCNDSSSRRLVSLLALTHDFKTGFSTVSPLPSSTAVVPFSASAPRNTRTTVFWVRLVSWPLSRKSMSIVVQN